MSKADNPPAASGQFTTDILVAGAGVMGLWAAVKATEAGYAVTLIDRAAPGAGASGGLLGALFPWMPNHFGKKKKFQFDALISLPDQLAPLEAETGLSAGYARVGRIIPLPKAHLRPIAERHRQDAETAWAAPGAAFHWRVADAAPVAGYIDPAFADGGYVQDTLAARMSPRGLCAVLTTWLKRQPNVRIFLGTELDTVDPAAGRACLRASGASLAGLDVESFAGEILFDRLVLASGVDAFAQLEALLPPLKKQLGQGVKGQAALIAADLDPGLPVAFLDGVYVVPHAGGHVAVGSTSENTYDDPFATDAQLDDVLEKARALIPALRKAPVIERWAGLRPKAIARDPMLGPLPDHANILAMTGGFKISFGVAHALADALIDVIEGREPERLPDSFRTEAHLAEAG
ncbi:NAD(P)/FAD-dependent oxidoreductase [Rhizobium sp. TRM95796]|uniref:NAD(P)/FAD-dependent oxidoreductase n=1 Tax=Rhizobium sp. TRM95796 TaxID=2979862 RepID=UPI0021E72D7F|nr:FAD-binding oxidoreductase [Rhizobium sp. TRM95796]MCV3766669.1 FAD-binding oxidoreductase [Rhizobium sp. TRM95796]